MPRLKRRKSRKTIIRKAIIVPKALPAQRISVGIKRDDLPDILFCINELPHDIRVSYRLLADGLVIENNYLIQ